MVRLKIVSTGAALQAVNIVVLHLCQRFGKKKSLTDL